MASGILKLVPSVGHAMSEQRKLFSQADEFDFKRKFVIELLALQAMQSGEVNVEDTLAMAGKVWDAMVEHGVNDSQ